MRRSRRTFQTILLSLATTLVLPTITLGQSSSPAQNPSAGPDKTLAALAAQDPNTKKAKDLLNKMIAAMGGQPFLTYQTMTQEGRTYSFYQGQPNSLGTLFWRFWKYPDKDRIELTKQRDVTYIYIGDKGYEITYKGTAAVEPKDLSEYLLRRKYSLEQLVRVWMKDPATLVLYEGSALAERQFVEQVSLLNKDNESVTLGIDPNSGLVLKKSFTYRDYDGLKSTDDEMYANYRPEQGIQTAHTIVRYHNGQQTGQRFLTKVEYNVPIEEGKFEAKVTYDMYQLKKK
ncbi:MAG: hypothetical protein ACM3JB_25085 [Acidobacteriaceae bacterium]